jgi:hypothetical protein
MQDNFLKDWLDKNMPSKLDKVEEEDDTPLHVVIWMVLVLTITLGMLIGGMR